MMNFDLTQSNTRTVGYHWNKKTQERLNSPLFLEQYGYKVFSQNDEDGILQEIIQRLPAGGG